MPTPDDPHAPDPYGDPFGFGPADDIPTVHPDSPAPVDEVPITPAMECWRCGRFEVPVRGRCPRCDARLGAPERSRPVEHAPPSITVVLVAYALMLLVSVVWGWALFRGNLGEDDILTGTAVLEFLDTCIVVGTLLVVGSVGLPRPPAGTRVSAWAVAGPALFLLLCLNLAYVSFLREILKVDAAGPPLSAVIVLLFCVQPAIVEELFFRYTALGLLHRATGVHTAVWVSAVMFAMAHIYNPLGTPYLFLAGVVLGYARVYGGLALPMVMHFVHNLAVVLLEGVR